MFGRNRGVQTTCPNCGGHTRLTTKYGECDYCGSPLIAPIPVEEMPTPIPKKSIEYGNSCSQRREILEIINDSRRPLTVSEIVNLMEEPIASQKCAALLRQLMSDGHIERGEERKKAVFFKKGA